MSRSRDRSDRCRSGFTIPPKRGRCRPWCSPTVAAGSWVTSTPTTRSCGCWRSLLGSPWSASTIRFPPEQKFPIALEECLALLTALAERGSAWGLDPARLAMAGDSAGANLTLGTALSLKASGSDLLKAGLLYYGGFGLEQSESRRRYGGDGMSAGGDLAFYSRCYLRGEADRVDPRWSGLRADLTGLPPSLRRGRRARPVARRQHGSGGSAGRERRSP